MKKFFRIAVKGTSPVLFFDLEVAQDVSLPNFWTNIRMGGGIVTENFCVPYDQIAHISTVTIEQVQTAGFTPRVVN